MAARDGPGSPGSWVSGCLEASMSGDRARRRGDKESGKERERKTGARRRGSHWRRQGDPLLPLAVPTLPALAMGTGEQIR